MSTLDAFFANVECLRHPALQGRPLIVGGVGDPMPVEWSSIPVRYLVRRESP